MGIATIRGMSPGKLGHGCSASGIKDGIGFRPNYIAVDAGSTDMGAYYMGAGVPFFHPISVRTDLRHLLLAARSLRIPLIIGNAITAGTDALVDQALTVLRALSVDLQLEVKVAVVRAEVSRRFLLERLAEGRITPLGADSALTREAIEDAAVIVAQMGVEPLIRALETGADIVVAGRACDDALFAAEPVREGFDRGLALHMGKILECGSMACVPGDLHGSLVGELHDDHFLLIPPEPHRVCTVQSVTSHTLYERTNPYLQPGPGGVNDLRETSFVQLNEREVEVRGSRWTWDESYKVKIEGVRRSGFRTICMTGIRDPFLIRCISTVLESAAADAADRFSAERQKYELIFRQYGRNAVMGALEPESEVSPHELGLLIEVIAQTQELADAICMYVRGTIQHAYYPGIVATAGNLAYPFSPFTVSCGPAFRFHIDHLLELDRPDECFAVTTEQIGRLTSGVGGWRGEATGGVSDARTSGRREDGR